MSGQTRVLFVSPIRFDNEGQKCYDTAVFTDVIHKRITKKVRYPTLRGHPKGLLRMGKCTCSGYLQMNPFFQTERMGFVFFQARKVHLCPAAVPPSPAPQRKPSSEERILF